MMLDLLPSTIDKITVYSNPKSDDWGQLTYTNEKVFPCRVSFNSSRKKITTSKGDEVVYTASLSMNGLKDIRYSDKIEYKDFVDNWHKKDILSIEYKRDLSGEVIMTKVIV